MLGFLRSKTPVREIMNGFYDIHSHVLPGVDDGCREMSQSQQVMDELGRMGVRGMYATPHVSAERYPANNSNALRETFSTFVAELNDARTSVGIGVGVGVDAAIDIRLGAEYLIEADLANHLSDPLSIGANCLLVEFSMNTLALNAMQQLFDVKEAGYTPIIAHPERYRFMTDELWNELVGMNCRMQLNLLSLAGVYGDVPRAWAQKMLAAGNYHNIGADVHSMRQIDLIKTCTIARSDARRLDLLVENNKIAMVGLSSSVGMLGRSISECR